MDKPDGENFIDHSNPTMSLQTKYKLQQAPLKFNLWKKKCLRDGES